MDLGKAVAKRIAVWGVLGLVGGGFAADMLWRQKGAQEQASLRAQQTEELQRLQAQVKSLTDELAAERLRREALERSVSEGRK
jgi:Skp family chaperone for outer membrane proteins